MAGVLFYRYTNDFEASIIRHNRRIEPAPGQTCKWFTPDFYETGQEAKSFLALNYIPTHRVGPIPMDYLPDFDHVPLRPAEQAHGEPGGGVEAATTKTTYLFDITAIP